MEQNILKYKAFVTAVDTGSFSRAAAILNYSQSGISRMIGVAMKSRKELSPAANRFLDFLEYR